MLFDVQAALAEILGDTPATIATPATSRTFVAKVADVATCREETAPPADVLTFPPAPSPTADDPFRHGRSVTGKSRTWTGRVVSLADWAKLSDWDRHGSTGQMWNGLTRQWEPKGGRAT